MYEIKVIYEMLGYLCLKLGIFIFLRNGILRR